MAVTELDLIIRLEGYYAAKTTSSYHLERPSLNVTLEEPIAGRKGKSL
jgi:hypothetical protein